MIHACQSGYEAFLAKELEGPVLSKGSGWVRSSSAPARGLCFAHYSLENETELAGGSTRALAKALVDFFLKTSVGERYDDPWPLVVEGASAKAALDLFLELAGKRMSRVVKLARPGRPSAGRARGLFAFLPERGRLFVSRTAHFGGQRRMADDPRAPSRSYLKIEEACTVLGRGPKPGETVVDLGAAPGGWSYSAARRGAKVLAVDNGPLKAGALANPSIEHRREDAFMLAPLKTDWLFCDLVEDPGRVLDLVGRWLSSGLCGSFVVNLKFARQDPLPLLRRARQLRSPEPLVRHLFHDREELTVMGLKG